MLIDTSKEDNLVVISGIISSNVVILKGMGQDCDAADFTLTHGKTEFQVFCRDKMINEIEKGGYKKSWRVKIIGKIATIKGDICIEAVKIWRDTDKNKSKYVLLNTDSMV